MSITDASPIGERLLSVHAKITELEKEVEGALKVLGTNTAGERNPKRIEALKAAIATLKTLLENARNVIDEYLRRRDNGSAVAAADDDGDDPHSYRSSLNRLLEKALQFCGTKIPDTDDESDDHRRGDHDLAISAALGHGEISGPGDDDQDRMSRVSQIAPEMEVKKTFLQWLEVEKTASDHIQGVVELGTRLSRMVLEFFFFLVSVNGCGDILEIIGAFKTALEAKTRFWDKKSSLVVVDTFLKLLEFGEEEARKSDEKIEPESADFIGVSERESLLDKFCEQILNVEAFLNRMVMSRHAIAETMRVGLEECGAELNSIEQEVCKWRLLELSTFKDDEPASVVALRRRLDSKARELWGGFGSD